MPALTILIIDDDADLCGEIAESLQARGYRARPVPDPAEAERLLAERAFDIVILDYKMPGADGVSLLKRIKALRPRTSVIMITGRPFMDKFLREEQVSALVAGLLTKPFDERELLRIVARVARGR